MIKCLLASNYLRSLGVISIKKKPLHLPCQPTSYVSHSRAFFHGCRRVWKVALVLWWMLEVVAPRSRVMVRDTPARLGLGKANKSGFVEPRRTVKPVFLLPIKKKIIGIYRSVGGGGWQNLPFTYHSLPGRGDSTEPLVLLSCS